MPNTEAISVPKCPPKTLPAEADVVFLARAFLARGGFPRDTVVFRFVRRVAAVELVDFARADGSRLRIRVPAGRLHRFVAGLRGIDARFFRKTRRKFPFILKIPRQISMV